MAQVSTQGDVYKDAALPVAFDLFGETVTYTLAGASSGTNYTAVPTDLPDGSDYLARRYRVKTANVATPKRADTITDAASVVWDVVEVGLSEGGETPLDCRTPQERT